MGDKETIEMLLRILGESENRIDALDALIQRRREELSRQVKRRDALKVAISALQEVE